MWRPALWVVLSAGHSSAFQTNRTQDTVLAEKNSNEKESPLKSKAGLKALPVAKNTCKIPSQLSDPSSRLRLPDNLQLVLPLDVHRTRALLFGKEVSYAASYLEQRYP